MATRDTDDIKIDWWNERDRKSVVAYLDDHDVELWEAWDDDVDELIEDGFLKWDDDDSVIEHMSDIGAIEFADDDGNEFTIGNPDDDEEE